jgi:hypothetical protein
MKYSDFYEKFQDQVMPKEQIRNTDVLYVISHQKNMQPYKIGISKTNIYGRLNAYRTPFIDFEVELLIALPEEGARLMERSLHFAVPSRIEFPNKIKEQTTVRMSEWFNTSINVILRQIIQTVKNDFNIRPIRAWNLQGKSPEIWHSLDKIGDMNRMKYIKSLSKGIKTKSGRISRKPESMYNNEYKKYLGMIVQDYDKEDIGVVIEVPKTKRGKFWVKWGDKQRLATDIEMIEAYAKEYGIKKK